MLRNVLLLLPVFISTLAFAQSKEALIEKYWYVNCDSLINPEHVNSVTFTSEKPGKNYSTWAFMTDGELGYGVYLDYREEGDITDHETPKTYNVFFSFHGRWRITGNTLHIGKLKFRILELSPTTLSIEKK